MTDPDPVVLEILRIEAAGGDEMAPETRLLLEAAMEVQKTGEIPKWILEPDPERGRE